ncbi:MAG: cofactor-independent phosphoglycerate mutase [Cellulosilyticaceae bacterium]
MKYIVVLLDGMADEPIISLEGKTPLEYAKTVTMDKYAPYSEIGMVNTIPKGCAKGSDIANLAILGYNPQQYYFGRSPFEALSIGVELNDTDITFRTNIITVSEDENDYDDKTILDHSAGEITTEEANQLIEVIQNAFGDEIKKFYTGASYRHLLVWNGGSANIGLIPPHDIVGLKAGEHKPEGEHAEFIWDITKKSYELLNNHPINESRRKKGLKPANSIWIWGEGSKPNLPSFKSKYDIDGAVISAVDLIKGIGITADMVSIDVEGATGNIHTNYEGKKDAALKWLIDEDKDFIYIHLEGPDEAGHRNEQDNKIKAIEEIDKQIIGPVLKMLEEKSIDYKLMVLPDHATPLSLRTHTSDPVPYMIYDSTDRKNYNAEAVYTEKFAKNTGIAIKDGHYIMKYFIQK